MSLTRIYLPLNAARLRELSAERCLLGSPYAAHAVTDMLRAVSPGTDEEEREYLALTDAAESSRALLGPGERRRIVAAADVEASWLCEGASTAGSSVTITADVPLKRIASIHVDDADAAVDDELLWYDATELPVILELL